MKNTTGFGGLSAGLFICYSYETVVYTAHRPNAVLRASGGQIKSKKKGKDFCPAQQSSAAIGPTKHGNFS
jgi:hypothetical protein